MFKNRLAFSSLLAILLAIFYGIFMFGQSMAFAIEWKVPNYLAFNPKPTNVFELIFAVTDELLNIAAILIVILIIYSGVRFMISRGNPTEVGKARTTLWWATVGFMVVLIGKGFVFVIEAVLKGQPPSF